MTLKKRKIKIVNTLTKHEDIIEVLFYMLATYKCSQVPCEETIYEIQDRYKGINYHAASYTWKRMKKPLDMIKTLEENNILDDTEEVSILEIPEKDFYVPAIFIYFNDDLSVL